MHLYERRDSDLGPKLWPGAELEASPAVVLSYEEAPDLPGPIQAVGTTDGPIIEAWCPQCQEAITGADRDDIVAVSPLTTASALGSLWPEHQVIAVLITVRPCGHAFRLTDGQTIVEVREPAA